MSVLKLYGRHLTALSASASPEPFVARVSTNAALPLSARANEVLLLEEDADHLPDGFRAYLLRGRPPIVDKQDAFQLGEEFAYLAAGDVIRIDPRHGAMSVLYRRGSAFNSILVTERCDNYCVMCSQPPTSRDDRRIVDDVLTAIPLMAPDTPEIGITGGEPGLLGDRLATLIERLRAFLPRTAVHVLTNGRAFADESFARRIAATNHPDLMLGIPLYSALPERHDYIVQAHGAYDETLRGILNLKSHRVRVEIRFVIHHETYQDLPEFARFIARNLTFVDHVALMGLELMGFARANLDALWIDPLDYAGQLAEAAFTLDRAGLRVSIYNHQLCVLAPELHRFARASISDWKNCYFAECDGCSLRGRCGGFFASSKLRRSRGITPVKALA